MVALIIPVLERLRQEDHEFKAILLHTKARLQRSGNASVYLPRMCEALDFISTTTQKEMPTFSEAFHIVTSSTL